MAPMTTSSVAVFLRARASSLDPITPLVGLVALVVYSLHGFGGVLNRDLGVYAYAGQQFADGVPPYEGILNRAGPLAHMLPGVGMVAGRVVGVDDVTSARVLFMLLAAGAVCATYVVGRDLFLSRWAGLASAASLLSFLGFIEYATNGPREKTPMVLFVLLTLWMLTRHRFLAAGAFVGLATLTWQPAFLLAMTAAVLAALLRPGRRIRSLAEVLVGGAVTTLVFAAYFLTTGALDAFYQGFFEINARYSGAVGFDDRPAYIWGALGDAYGASLWIFLFGLLALLVAAVAAAAVPSRRLRPDASLRVAFGAATLLGLVWTWRDVNGWPDVFVLLPSAALGVGAIVAEVEARVPARAARVVLIGVTAWALAATAYATVYSVTERSDKLAGEQASVDAVLRSMPADATMMSVDAPQVLVLSDRTNPTRLLVLPPSIQRYVDRTYPGGLRGFAAWLAEREPTVLAVHGNDTWLAPVLASSYKRVGSGPGWGWYMAKSAGPEAIRNVIDALHSPPS
jgi:4-amino-4-deoxy-L-arabinose transferase-like glycosyltransferase